MKSFGVCLAFANENVTIRYMIKIVIRLILLCNTSLLVSCAYNNAEELYGIRECLPDDTGTSFSLSILPIIEGNCAVSDCHTVGQQQPTFLNYEQISSYANKIKSRTSNGTMPPPESGIHLDQLEIDKIACWVENGALDN